MFRFRLRTLLILNGVMPPAIATVWFGWRQILVLAVCIALLALWILVSLTLARLFAGLLVSVMD
jgi:hypothetical protein